MKLWRQRFLHNRARRIGFGSGPCASALRQRFALLFPRVAGFVMLVCIRTNLASSFVAEYLGSSGIPFFKYFGISVSVYFGALDLILSWKQDQSWMFRGTIAWMEANLVVLGNKRNFWVLGCYVILCIYLYFLGYVGENNGSDSHV